MSCKAELNHHSPCSTPAGSNRVCWACAVVLVNTADTTYCIPGLLLGPEPPILAPNGIDFFPVLDCFITVLQGTAGPFKTAKAIMLEDMRKKGQTYRPQATAASQEADRHPSAAQAPFKRLGPGKPSQKRAGELQLM